MSLFPRVFVSFCALGALLPAPASALPALASATAPELAPDPALLLAQNDGDDAIDDTDLQSEPDIRALDREVFDKDAWSTGKAIGLSLIPGAGFGLMYADQKAAAFVPFILSAVGYGVGIAHVLGAFDESTTEACSHSAKGDVAVIHCQLASGNDPDPRDSLDNHNPDPNDAMMRAYFETGAEYTTTVVGEDFDGKERGLIILGATYVGTTLLGAVWAGLTVSDHNEALLKSIESTAQAPAPTLYYDGDRGYAGLSFDF